ncbi:Equilibrative Nucleoside Transporter (ENT) Family, partial [Achlya hypogyna]
MDANYHEAVDIKGKDLNDHSDEIPQHILDEIKQYRSMIYWSLLFLEGSAMWAYYSCLSAQDYYASTFPDVKFSFLTTPVLTWPLTIGHIIQMWFGYDRSIGNMKRVIIGYAIFAICCVLIILQGYLDMDQTSGATMVLVCFGFVGAAQSLTEPAYYNVASLFPDAHFTNGIQVGNVSAGVLNVVLAALIHLAVGGVHDSDPARSLKLAFFIFMAMLLIICVGAVYIYWRLEKVPCVRYLMDRAAADHLKHGQVSLPQLWAKFFRVGKVIVLPMAAQFMLFFCTLTLYPGVGMSSVAKELFATPSGPWLTSPGIVAPFNFGDLIGRLASTKTVASYFSMRSCFVISILRWVWLPLLLMASVNNSLFVFGDNHWGAYAFILVLYLLLGISG